MRTILVLCAVTLMLGGVLVWKAVRMPSHYGAFTGAPKVEVADIVERPKRFFAQNRGPRRGGPEPMHNHGMLFLLLLRQEYVAR